MKSTKFAQIISRKYQFSNLNLRHLISIMEEIKNIRVIIKISQLYAAGLSWGQFSASLSWGQFSTKRPTLSENCHAKNEKRKEIKLCIL